MHLTRTSQSPVPVPTQTYIHALCLAAHSEVGLELLHEGLLQYPVVPVAIVAVLGLVKKLVRLDVGGVALVLEETLQSFILYKCPELGPLDQLVDYTLHAIRKYTSRLQMK